MNPGSTEAIAAGCQCPVMDNNHGRFSPYPRDGWYINLECPVHGQAPLWEGDDDGPQGPAEPDRAPSA